MTDDAAAPHSGRAIARNTLFNLLGRGIPLLVGLLVLPFVVRGLGEARFGLFAIGMAVISSFFVFDLGLGRAVAKYSAAYRASKQEDAIPPLLWSAVLLQLGLGSLAGLAMAAITPYLVENVLEIAEPMWSEARRVFYLLAATVILALTEYSFAGALEGYQRFGAINAVRAPLNTLSLLFILWVAQTGNSLALFFAFVLATRVLLILLLLGISVRTIPGLFKRMRPTRQSIAPLVHFGKWVTVSNVVAPALLYADRFLLGSLGGMAQVAYYTAPFQVVERLLIIPGTLTSTLFPAISALDQTDARHDVQRLSGETLHYLLCIMGLIGVGLSGVAPWLVWVFFGEAYLEPSLAVFRILVLGFSINALSYVPFSVIQGCGRPDITAKLHVIEFPIHLLLLAIGYHLGGLPGVAWAWTLRVALDGALLLIVCLRLGWMDSRVLRELPVGRNATVLLLAGFGLSFVPWDAGLIEMGAGGLVLVGTVLYTVLLGLRPMDRARIVAFLRSRTTAHGGN